MGENEFFNRKNLPRLFELADENAAFQGFLRDDDSPSHIPIKRKVLRDFEADLCALDANAWASFKKKAVRDPCLLKGGYSQTAKPTDMAKETGYDGLDLPRSWQPLNDLRNEAKGYGYLKSIGCDNIEWG